MLHGTPSQFKIVSNGEIVEVKNLLSINAGDQGCLAVAEWWETHRDEWNGKMD